MHEDYQDILRVKPNKVSRKLYLEPIAKELKIETRQYKNRMLLHEAICNKLNKPSSRCENESDPITLEPIDDLPKEFLFEWDQNGKHYGADVRSLKAMIERDQTILPWAIDSDTGISQSKDNDSYLQKYDLKYVKGLIDEIKNIKVENYDFQYDEISDCIKYRFSIENSTSQYITHLIDYIEKQQLKYAKQLYFKALSDVCNQYNGEMLEGNSINMTNVIQLSILTQIAHTILHETSAKTSLELLVYCINTIKVYFETNSQNIIDLLFMTLNEFKNSASN